VTDTDAGKRHLDATMKMVYSRMHIPETASALIAYEEAYKSAAAERDSIIRDASDAELEDIARAMAISNPSWPRMIRELGYESQLDYLREMRRKLRGDAL
jgi:hypothetical protein